MHENTNMNEKRFVIYYIHISLLFKRLCFYLFKAAIERVQKLLYTFAFRIELCLHSLDDRLLMLSFTKFYTVVEHFFSLLRTCQFLKMPRMNTLWCNNFYTCDSLT